MFLTSLRTAQDWVEVLQSAEGSRTSVVNLSPGEASAEVPNGRPGSDQVLLVLDGEVIAEIEDEKARMQRGDVVIVPDGARRRFRNDTTAPARTLCVYTPLAW
jgi:mannose-6-phosphate isomerase-like protein (cupin superfamily)